MVVFGEVLSLSRDCTDLTIELDKKIYEKIPNLDFKSKFVVFNPCVWQAPKVSQLKTF